MIYKVILILFMLLVSTCSTGYSESGSTLFDNGIAEFQKGRYQDAIFWFTKLIEKEPFNAKAYKNRGVARLSLQKYDMAIEDLNNALNPDPALEDLTGNLGPAWHYKDEYKKAMDDFNSALNLDPDLEGIHSNIGVAWYYAREYQKAIEAYTKEVKKFPENYSAFFNRALSWVELKEYQNALNDLKAVLDIKPDEYWAIAYKGDIYSELKNLTAARESYLAAMALNTGNKYAGDKLRLLDAVGSASQTVTPPPSSGFDDPMKAPETNIPASVPKQETVKTQKILPGDRDTQTKKTIKKKVPAKHTEKTVLANQSENSVIDMAAQTDIQSDQTPVPQKQTMVEPVTPTTEPSPVAIKASAPPRFTIQLGAFLNSENAADLIKRLDEKGYKTVLLNMQDKKNRQWTLVRTGGFETKRMAKDCLDEIKKDLKLDGAIRPFGKF